MTISAAIAAFLEEISLSRDEKTARAYRVGLKHFQKTLRDAGIQPDQDGPGKLSEDLARRFLEDLQRQQLSPATQRLYLSGLKGFLQYLNWEKLARLDMASVARFSKARVARSGYRIPAFPKDQLEQVIAHAEQLAAQPAANETERRRNLRDRAFILTLADTGLRVHEACGLRRGEIDWQEGKAIIIGKGDKQAVIRFSERSLAALREYLQARQTLDGASGRRLAALPVFIGHDHRGEKRLSPMTTKTGRAIIRQRAGETLGDEAAGLITPHTFRHYFVTTVLLATGGNIHLAQKLARHSNISVTERYAHLADEEMDQGYHEIFNRRD